MLDRSDIGGLRFTREYAATEAPGEAADVSADAGMVNGDGDIPNDADVANGAGDDMADGTIDAVVIFFRHHATERGTTAAHHVHRMSTGG